MSINDMPHMATMVYEMYMKKIQALREEEKLKAHEVCEPSITYCFD